MRILGRRVRKQRRNRAELREIVERVLSANESRCLDDDADREVVLRELVEALI